MRSRSSRTQTAKKPGSNLTRFFVQAYFRLTRILNAMRGFGLATKIAVPFVLLFMALLVAVGFVLAREIFREIENYVENELDYKLTVASDLRMPLNEAFLQALQRKPEEGERGAELIVLSERGAPLTTLETNSAQDVALLRAVISAASTPEKFPGLGGQEALERTLSTRMDLADERYLVFYRTRLLGGSFRQYFVLYPQSNIEAVQRRALWRMAGLGVGGLLLAALLGRLVAHWIIRPVRRLALSAGQLAAGGLNEPLEPAAVEATDEIGELTRAFAAMVESLRRSQNELVKAERLAATGKLAASVAHEIRNPLTSLRMTLQMLAEKDEKQHHGADREAYQVVLGEIDRLALAVEELLTFARPRPPQRVPTDLNRLVLDTVKFLERQLLHSRIKAVVETDATLPAAVAVDPNKVRQLLVNLILNAMQAMVRDGTVTLRTRGFPDQRKAVLEVADTGPGIQAEVRDRVFDPFVSTKPGGGGLGLAIAKQVVEEHGGAIRFETGATGTIFFVEFPVDVETTV